ncbi:hypothetical protein AG1IA_06908 [Rhizoctonia solani AG-1 IA]|uniref:Uncharacterized protein n=1 Tax=Thanatephorus cucumeris (strain AG1-IA) TaxID=983506 RepID=L8WLJ7_THACA|nr:hypothetical protein AG1IA_06908 [Rhizoctonia solani AG-1 IA]
MSTHANSVRDSQAACQVDEVSEQSSSSFTINGCVCWMLCDKACEDAKEQLSQSM